MQKNPTAISIKEEPNKVPVGDVHVLSAPNGRDASSDGSKDRSSDSLIKSRSTEQQELCKKSSNYKKNAGDPNNPPFPDSDSTKLEF